jgi:hypothetical protein
VAECERERHSDDHAESAANCAGRGSAERDDGHTVIVHQQHEDGDASGAPAARLQAEALGREPIAQCQSGSPPARDLARQHESQSVHG